MRKANAGTGAGRAALAALAALLLVVSTGCGSDDRERSLEEANAAVEQETKAVEEAKAAVAGREAELQEARGRLEEALEALSAAEGRLAEARARVALFATDEVLFRTVQIRLLEDPQLEDLAISARVESGVVTLSGSASNAEIRDHAVEVARSTPGVTAVESRIRIPEPAVSAP